MAWRLLRATNRFVCASERHRRLCAQQGEPGSVPYLQRAGREQTSRRGYMDSSPLRSGHRSARPKERGTHTLKVVHFRVGQSFTDFGLAAAWRSLRGDVGLQPIRF
jgi:hypothetical protein